MNKNVLSFFILFYSGSSFGMSPITDPISAEIIDGYSFHTRPLTPAPPVLPYEFAIISEPEPKLSEKTHQDSCAQAIKQEPLDGEKPLRRILAMQMVKFYECPEIECTRKFKTSKETKDHFARKHSQDKPFGCDVKNCQKEYSTKSSLYLHKQRTHAEKKFECFFSYCDASYALRGDRNQHLMRKHRKYYIKK